MWHLCAELGNPVGRDFAVGNEARIRSGEILREQFAARNLDVKVLLKTKHNVQEVDRLCTKVANQSGFRCNFVIIYT